ncbi:MAG: GNAT family N-acetyltransferase [Pseudomonadota bacterium]
MGEVAVRPVGPGDEDAVWAILEPVFRAGDTYTIDPGVTREAALGYWLGPSHRVFVAGEGLGTYYVRPNQGGGGDHVCNCGYVTAAAAQGKGVARAMLAHSLIEARRLGFRAMQYNFVVETNTRAIEIWTRAGFETVGRLPGAFRHPEFGFVDALILYKDLTKES